MKGEDSVLGWEEKPGGLISIRKGILGLGISFYGFEL